MTAGLFLGLLLLLSLSVWISFRQRQENALKSKVLAATNCSVLVTDAAMSHQPVVYVNPAFLLLTGYAESEVIGRTAAIFTGPDTDRASMEKLAMALQDGRACRVRLRHYRKDGTSFWNEVTLSPVEDITGRLTSVIWMMNEVVKPEEVTESSDKTQDSPTVLSDLASVGMFVMRETEITYVNRAGLKLLGATSSDEVVGKRSADLVHPDFHETVRRHMEQAHASSNSGERLEARFQRVDGQPIDVDMSTVSVLWEEQISSLVCFSDISDRKREDTAANRYRERLSHAQSITHELNNSLTAVLGFSELALPLIASESKAHRHVSQVIAAGRKARELAHIIREALEPSSLYPPSTAAPPEALQEPSTLPMEVSDAVGPRG